MGNVRPLGADVVGGVKASPGVKDCDTVQKIVGGAKKMAAKASKGF